MHLSKRVQLFKRLLIPLVLLVCLTIIGSLGYMLIENYNFLEAFYMTIITVASVGFNEVHPLSDTGRVFTIFLIVINLGLFTYFISLLSRYFFDIEFINKYKMINYLFHFVVIPLFFRY